MNGALNGDPITCGLLSLILVLGQLNVLIEYNRVSKYSKSKGI